MSTYLEVKKASAEGASSLVLFYSLACAPCARLKPRLTALTRNLGVALHLVNIASEMDHVRALGIRSVPTAVSLVGDKATVLFSGELADERIAAMLNEAGLT